MNVNKGYRDICGEGDINVAYISSPQWFRINETTQTMNTKDFPVGPVKKWSVGGKELSIDLFDFNFHLSQFLGNGR